MLIVRGIVLSLGLAVLSFGQADANKGQILGTVTDPNGAAVPIASVTIRNPGTGLLRDLKTDENGRYRAVLLDPGNYEVVGQSTGFAATTVAGIVLPVWRGRYRRHRTQGRNNHHDIGSRRHAATGGATSTDYKPQ
jgi:protocatechuate 3,4-dioxygenase beta subunit